MFKDPENFGCYIERVYEHCILTEGGTREDAGPVGSRVARAIAVHCRWVSREEEEYANRLWRTLCREGP